MDYTDKYIARFVIMFIRKDRDYVAFKTRTRFESKNEYVSVLKMDFVKKWVEHFEATELVQNC